MGISVVLCFLLGATVSLASWSQLERADQNQLLPIRFALKQYNLDVLEATLLDVSNPASNNYGKWWNSSAILALVSPPASVSNKVVSFLLENGALNVENHMDMVKCDMYVRDIEATLQTRLYLFRHTNGKSTIIRTNDGYQVPSSIAEHVFLVAGIEEFPQFRVSKTPKSIDAASGLVTVPHIQALYGIPSTFPTNAKSSIGLIEFQDDQAYDKDDLSRFVSGMGIPNITVTHKVGPFDDRSPDGESTLDVQYGGAIALNTSVWFWVVKEWMYEFATDLLAAKEAPLVVSMSWGWPEPLQCQIDPRTCGRNSSLYYVERVNVEFQKIGLRGITLVAASGDNGAPGNGNSDCSNSTYPLWNSFPGSSPWVLSVGATMLAGDLEKKPTLDAANPPVCNSFKCATSTTEEVCSYPGALITTGGGFSNVSPRPAYQNVAVNAYLSSGVTLPSDAFFNKSNRGFPDVSALGHNYLINWEAQWGPVDGTSCSSPVLAAIISLLNSERLNNNKTPLGFAVPVMYAAQALDSTTFTDLTKGNNKCTEQCCDKVGYVSSAGWDPVTGLGTPQFPKLLKYVQSLP